jgi:hypothetical protein
MCKIYVINLQEVSACTGHKETEDVVLNEERMKTLTTKAQSEESEWKEGQGKIGEDLFNWKSQDKDRSGTCCYKRCMLVGLTWIMG